MTLNPTINNAEQLDLTDSVFTTSSVPYVNAALEKFDFVPISSQDVSIWHQILEGSQILDYTTITPEFIAMFPKIQDGGLLYRMTRDKSKHDKFMYDNGKYIRINKTSK